MKLQGYAWALVIAGLVGAAVVAQQTEESAPSSAKPKSEAAAAPVPAPANAPPSSEDVMKNMLNQVEQNPLIEPSQRPRRATDDRPPLDPRILGTAPGAQKPKLKAEGEFVVSRRGRISRAPDGIHVLFVFESDEKDAPEAPMILVPCQTLQSMEDIVRDRGDRIVFKLSGQVLAYRGLNYLLPTMMNVEFDRGNLQP